MEVSTGTSTIINHNLGLSNHWKVPVTQVTVKTSRHNETSASSPATQLLCEKMSGLDSPLGCSNVFEVSDD